MKTQTKPIDAKAYNDALHEPGVEFVDGEIREKDMSAVSSELAATISAKLHAANRLKACRFYAEMSYRCFADDPMRFRKPDVSVVLRSRLHDTEPEDGFFAFAPDLAIEFISPSESAYDVDQKISDYLANGFGLIWVVYPKSKSVVEYSGKLQRTLRDTDELVAPTILPEFSCKVSELFE